MASVPLVEGKLEPPTSALDGISLSSIIIKEEVTGKSSKSENEDDDGAETFPADPKEMTDVKEIKKV